jgi:hypothetical protein
MFSSKRKQTEDAAAAEEPTAREQLQTAFVDRDLINAHIQDSEARKSELERQFAELSDPAARGDETAARRVRECHAKAAEVGVELQSLRLALARLDAHTKELRAAANAEAEAAARVAAETEVIAAQKEAIDAVGEYLTAMGRARTAFAKIEHARGVFRSDEAHRSAAAMHHSLDALANAHRALMAERNPAGLEALIRSTWLLLPMAAQWGKFRDAPVIAVPDLELKGV